MTWFGYITHLISENTWLKVDVTLEAFKIGKNGRREKSYDFWFDPDDYFNGLYVISKDKLLEILKIENQFLKEEIDFLHWYSELPIFHRDLLVNTLCSENSPDYKMNRHFLSNWLNQAKFAEIKQIKNSDFSDTQLKESLIKTGFKISTCSYITQSRIIDRPMYRTASKSNYFFSTCGRVFEKMCYVLAPNKIYEEVEMHVTIAEIDEKL